jgi:Response regulators consisting of a CheY-like receiver domain and a winged-helix DNA-binding domain
MTQHILIMEDDFDIQEVIAEFLKAKDYAVTAVADGLEGIRRFNRESFDLVIVDVMMPNISGYEVVRTIRSKSDIPTIMLTALGDETDQIRGFEAGIDDYVTKPFSFELLIRRVEAVLRRSRAHSPERSQYALNELRIDCDAYKAYVHDREVALTTREFEIVRTLLANRGKVVTRERMLESVWGYDFFGDTRLIDTHIKNIRKRLNVPYIKTIKGVGYKIDE